MKKYKNRYNDEFTFTLDEDGNILWEGNFNFCRIGYPNDYTKAYNAYVGDGGKLSFKEFQDTVHQYDEEKRQYILDNKYIQLVESLTHKIDMVDPSGGPYITAGSNMGRYSEEFKGMIVKEFQSTDTGLKIIIK